MPVRVGNVVGTIGFYGQVLKETLLTSPINILTTSTDPKKKGDPSRLIKATEPDSITPDGQYVEGNPNNFVAVGKEEDILESLRQRGWSEAAIAAFKSGKSIIRNKVRPDPKRPDNEIILGEKWNGKKDEEGY